MYVLIQIGCEQANPSPKILERGRGEVQLCPDGAKAL